MTDGSQGRKPQVFDPGDPRLRESVADADAPMADETTAQTPPPGSPVRAPALRIPTAADINRGINWGLWLVGSAISLLIMSFALRFWSFVWDLFLRRDWIGWLAVGLAAVLVLSLAMLLIREIVGFFRLSRLQSLRKRSDRAASDLAATGKRADIAEVIAAIRALYADRPELAWARTRLASHDKTIMSGPERLALTDRELMAAVDDQAKATIAQSARRVSVVTAITPFAVFDMGYVLYENLRMLRKVAAIYGGRPGFASLLGLARRVVAYVIASGGLALTDDLFGQFVSQGIAARLSARAGQGMFNGALTSRLGVAAIELCRPMPFIAAPKPRFRELALEVAKGLTGGKAEDKPSKS